MTQTQRGRLRSKIKKNAKFNKHMLKTVTNDYAMNELVTNSTIESTFYCEKN